MSRRNGVQKPGDVTACGRKGFFERCLCEVELRMEKNTVILWTDVAPHWGHWASWLVIKGLSGTWSLESSI